MTLGQDPLRLPTPSRRVLITGANGFLGRSLLTALQHDDFELLLSSDIQTSSAVGSTDYVQLDVRDAGLVEVLLENRIDTVVHLASIVTPPKGSDRAFEYDVDVNGTRNVLDACVAASVRHVLISSSGAAYGSHADNPAWLVETDALRGNPVFAYADHKRLVEEMLATYRIQHGQLLQTVFRIGTILGEQVDNQIPALFEKPKLLAIRGSDSPFVFIWNEDVAGAMRHALLGLGLAGNYNLAGDGALPLPEIARLLGKRTRALPAGLLKSILTLGQWTKLTRYGPEQLDFLRYRPVLDNHALKTVFGYAPRKTSLQAFTAFVQARDNQSQKRPVASPGAPTLQTMSNGDKSALVLFPSRHTPA
ncbi:MAG TPA: SDR family oxidoreductase [Burkholderiaceae bacterium]|nr:SDR family oxidoreductase [Burkholderiaceae bacterium]